MKVIRWSKIAFDVLFFLGIISIVLMIGLTVASPVIADLVKDSSDAVQSGTLFGVDFTVDTADLDTDTVTQFAYAVGTAIVASLAVGTYIAQQIRRSLRAVLDGRAFREENYGRLRRIAYATFALVPVGIVTDSWMSTVAEGSWHIELNLPLLTIAGGLLALAVAELYKAGITLEDEAELTV